jgi:hypothetical protein
MAEVVEAHKFFASDYDLIADFFWSGDVYETCRLLWNFCKRNISYVIEPEKSQTTKSPAAILTEAYGDCKHYAGFIAGVLDAINRDFGAGIKWKYCFANYDEFGDLPQHVFVKVKDNGHEIWIDPVLNRFDERLQPVSCHYKTVNMLSRVSGINNELYNVQYPAIGALPWVDIASGAISIVSNILGGDAVPNYPVKETKTFNSLKNSLLNDHVGTVAPGGVFERVPTSIQNAKDMLAKAIKRKAEEEAMGHGYGDGPGWDTLQMLYDETIKALQLFIGAAEELTAGATYDPTNPAAPGKKTNWLLIGGIGLGAFLLLSKKKKSVSGVGNKGLLLGAVGIGALIYFMKKKKAASELENLPGLPSSNSIMADGLTKEAIKNQLTAPYDTTAYGADVVNEYERPTKVSDPYDLVKQTEMIFATQY